MELDIRVVKKGAPPTDATRHYIGRRMAGTGESPLGNPFYLRNRSDMEERQQVVASYRSWLWDKIQDRASLQAQALEKLLGSARQGPIELECFCAPLPCHGDVIKSALSWLDTQPDFFSGTP